MNSPPVNCSGKLMRTERIISLFYGALFSALVITIDTPIRRAEAGKLVRGYYRGNQQRKHVVIETVRGSAVVLLPGSLIACAAQIRLEKRETKILILQAKKKKKQ